MFHTAHGKPFSRYFVLNCMMGVMAERLDGGEEGVTPLRDFGGWMASEQKRVFLLCRRLLNDSDEADSATQEVFLKAFRALERPGQAEIDHADRWLTRIAVNTCLDRLRSHRWQLWRRRPKPEDEQAILALTATRAPGPEEQLFATEIQARLGKALERLSAKQRTVFTLKHYDDRTLEEIADLLALDVGSVKSHMFRAVAKLRVELRDLYATRGRI